VDHEVSIQDIARESGRASARSTAAGLPGERRGDRTGGGVAGSHPHAGVVPAGDGASEVGAIPEGSVIAKAAGRVSGLAEAVLGPAFVGGGYFCASVGAVDEDTIKKYIESQKWDDDDQGFKIAAPTEH